jgi:hypothetical protein
MLRFKWGVVLAVQGIWIMPALAGEVVIENRTALGFIRGWQHDAGTMRGGERGHTEFGVEVTTETVRHDIVQGDDAGGRVDLEVGKIFNGGAGDDLVIAYKNPQISYGDQRRTPGVFLLGGAGSDTLVGSDGADYLVSGAGYDRLYGKDGPDTYIIGEHAGAITLIADTTSDTLQGWEGEEIENAQDTLRLPEGVSLAQLELSWGTVSLDTVIVESASEPQRAPSIDALKAYSTLNMTWGTNQMVRLVFSNREGLNRTGIEVVKFANGVSVGLDRLVAELHLGPPPDP